jgi:hypothetical protein
MLSYRLILYFNIYERNFNAVYVMKTKLTIAIYIHFTCYSRRLEKVAQYEVFNLCSPPSTLKMMKSMMIGGAGHVVLMWEKRNAYRVFVGSSEGRRQMGGPRYRW